MSWRTRNKFFPLESPLVMGILNITPDSFYDGGKFFDVSAAAKMAAEMKNNGADIIDVGGESSRPGSKPVSAEEEINRIIPVIKTIAENVDVAISVDTYKPEVAEEAIKFGAKIVNDISGCENPAMAVLIKKSGVGIVVMHKHGAPETMQNDPLDTDSVLQEVTYFLKNKTNELIDFGIEKEQIVIDPGIGFGKTFAANELIIRKLNEITNLGFPVLIGASRKRFIGEITGRKTEERLAGSLAAHLIAFLNGAKIIRTHDVAETKDALKVAVRLAGQNGAGSRTGTSAQRRAELPLRDFDNPRPLGTPSYKGCGEFGQNG